MIWIAPLAVQAALMFIDEFYFHRRRGLPLWERIGHPVDTIFFLAAVAGVEFGAAVFVPLAVVSCLVITKDEFIHFRLCRGPENWVHAMLFLIHPVVLFSLWQLHAQGLDRLVVGTFGVTSVFLLHQIFYWNVYRDARAPSQQ